MRDLLHMVSSFPNGPTSNFMQLVALRSMNDALSLHHVLIRVLSFYFPSTADFLTIVDSFSLLKLYYFYRSI